MAMLVAVGALAAIFDLAAGLRIVVAATLRFTFGFALVLPRVLPRSLSLLLLPV
jgi:hypothetical protein